LEGNNQIEVDVCKHSVMRSNVSLDCLYMNWKPNSIMKI